MLKPIFTICFLLISIVSFSQENDTSFELCQDVDVYPYYRPELTYKGGFWEIKQHFTRNYPAEIFQVLKNNSGIITVQFKINCQGETGDFVVQQCDLNYQPTVLDKVISDYFLEKAKTLKNWIPAQDEEGNVVNSHKFFSFRIKKGDLLEILPK